MIPFTDKLVIAQQIANEFGNIITDGDVLLIVRKFEQAMCDRAIELQSQYQQPCFKDGCSNPTILLGRYCKDHIFSA
jgi:hypothetical protein